MSQYLSAIVLSVCWSQQPNCSYSTQNSRCHWGLKGGSKSRHWGWADAGWTVTSNITDTIRRNSERLGVFLDESEPAARKTAPQAPCGWSAASRHILVIFAVCPWKSTAVCSLLLMCQSGSVRACIWIHALRVRKRMEKDVRPSWPPKAR